MEHNIHIEGLHATKIERLGGHGVDLPSRPRALTASMPSTLRNARQPGYFLHGRLLVSMKD